MGILSWFRSRRSADVPSGWSADIPDEPHSLIRLRYEDPDLEVTERAAAADVAAVEEDAKYFGSDSAADRDEL
jgi:hypothetical protein